MKKQYQQFLKNGPLNTNGNLYSARTTLNENNIPSKNRRYNSSGNIINESIDEVLIPGLPVNTKVKFDAGLMVKAIQYGLVILINYSGEKDKWRGGRERVIYPMVIGVNRNTGNLLIRGWHLTGWSISEKKEVKKEWRLFKSTNIKSMIFTGDFYRLPPRGYKMNDRAMTEKLVKCADFNEIRRNQDSLIKSGRLEKVGEQNIGKEDSSIISKIDIRTTDTLYDIKNPFSGYLVDYKNKPNEIKMTFLRNINKNEHIAVFGALGTVNRTIKVYEKNEFIGNFKVRKSYKGRDLLRVNNIDGTTIFPLYTFNKVIK